MAIDLKRNETRDWRPQHIKVPFRLAIHAAKRWTGDQKDFYSEMLGLCPALPAPMPLGQIVAVCTVVGFARTEAVLPSISDLEASWGNYEPGRWAWVTEDMRPLPLPVPWKGKQGFFNVPDDLLKP